MMYVDVFYDDKVEKFCRPTFLEDTERTDCNCIKKNK